MSLTNMENGSLRVTRKRMRDRNPGPPSFELRPVDRAARSAALDAQPDR